MPAHIKSALIGASVTIPIKSGKLVSHGTGTWKSAALTLLSGSRQQEPGRAYGISNFGHRSTRGE